LAATPAARRARAQHGVLGGGAGSREGDRMTTIAPPTIDRDAVLERYREHVSRGRASLAQLMAAGIETRSDGAFVYDQEGRRHLDCGGYGVFILGHRHPRVVE